MTLTEYCNQKTPQRMPTVTLSEGEYQVFSDIVQVYPNKYRLVHVHIFNHTYVQKSGSGRLYTTDGHGNPKRLSVFNIPEEKF